jgi:hypothetical protein
MANGNSFGVLFCVTTYGESHGGAVGVVVDGCPPRLPLSEADIQAELDRRRPGQSPITTPRPGSGSLPDPLRGFSGLYAGHPHPHPGAQPGCPPPGLPGDGHHLPPFPCRCHLPGQVRHPQLAGGRTGLSARNHWPGGCRGHCQEDPAPSGRGGDPGLRAAGKRRGSPGGSQLGNCRAGGGQHRPLPRSPSGGGHDPKN